MITKTQAFQTSDNKTHASLEEAQRHEIKLLFGTGAGEDVQDLMADLIITNQAKLLDILTTKSTSKPRARKVNGGTKKRRVEIDPRVQAESLK